MTFFLGKQGLGGRFRPVFLGWQNGNTARSKEREVLFLFLVFPKPIFPLSLLHALSSSVVAGLSKFLLSYATGKAKKFVLTE